ncbi:MAG: type II secretion system secretin GspD [Wenzhouxiangellaceae bacterium]|nr:type II secretion system secretin GspD [Wenzhouxiangellaceae bacterium]
MKARMVLLAGVMLVWTVAAVAQNGNPRHLLNFEDAELRSLITTVADITGRNFVVDPAVTGRVTVISSRELAADEVFGVFQSILAVHGFSAIEDGDLVRIVPDAAARFGARAGRESVQAADHVIRVLALQHVRATEVLPMLRSLVPQSAWLAAHDDSNTLLVADRAASVARLEAVVARLDAATGDGAEVISLGHASAAEVGDLVNQVYSAERPLAIADPRTNSIVLRGDERQRLRLRTLISHLDTPLDAGSGARVVYLRYANADNLVPVLERLLETGGEGGESSVRITAHEATNALVIAAPSAVFRELKSIIDQLDIRRAQVLVEAIIAEVAADTGRELGVQWQFFGSGESGAFGGTNFGRGGNNVLNLSAGLAAGGEGGVPVLPGGGLNLGFVDGRSNLLGIELLEIGALARALATDGNSNVLSTPSIVTLANESASINVGQEVPFLSGSFLSEGISTADGQVNPFQTIQREEVGLKLTVTPQINEDQTILLGIEQEVSSLAPVVGAVDLVTNKRTISTRVMVDNGAMLVLGGLISDDQTENVEKVPGLGNIPLLGELFTSRSTSRVKRNLMVFIRPRILDDPALTREISNQRYRDIRARQLRQQPGGLLGAGGDMPLLPELDDFLQVPGAAARPDGR